MKAADFFDTLAGNQIGEMLAVLFLHIRVVRLFPGPHVPPIRTLIFRGLPAL